MCTAVSQADILESKMG